MLRVCARMRGNVAGHEKFVLAQAHDDGWSQAARRRFCWDLARRWLPGRRLRVMTLTALSTASSSDASVRKFLDQVGDDFCVGFRDELVAFGEELILQLEIIFDDSVVHDDDFAGAIAVGVSVFFGGAAVRGPARVADAVKAVERSERMDSSRLRSLPGCAPNFQLSVVAHDGDARGVVAAIFQAPQAVEDQRHDSFRSDVANNSAHSIRLRNACFDQAPREQD